MNVIVKIDQIIADRKTPARKAFGGIGRASLALATFLLALAAFGQQSPPAPEAAPTQTMDQDSSGEAAPETMLPHLQDDRFWISGQANFVYQTHPTFYAKYSGPHSLTPNYQKALSRVLTLYTGARLNDSTEVIFDLEEAGGSALSTGFGLAGDTDLDIVRNPLLSKAPYVARLMIHKVFALSENKVESERNPLSLFSVLPRRRLEIRFGKLSMPDFFDQNSAASDTHLQFLNWTVDNNGAWDYAADTRGYTVGLVADYEDKNYGIKFGESLMPKVANGIDLVWQPWKAHAENYEFDWNHGVVPKKPGAIRLLGYTNYANMGIYRQAIAQYFEGSTAAPDITDHSWHIARKYGLGVNLEQAITPNFVAFARWGWDNGKTESFAYTEVDSTILTGLGAYGAKWHRKQDRAAFAFVSNGICKYHQEYLADGGLGFLLGDGGLSYGRENIEEMYYTAHVWRGIYLAPDVQHINNPGYNRDRGPVLVPGFRLHVEF